MKRVAPSREFISGRNPFDEAPEDLSNEFRVSAEQFSTKGLRGSDRVEKWESHNAKALLGLTARSIDEEPLDATELNLHLPRMNFAHVSANAHVIERNAAHIRKNSADAVVMYFNLFGEAFFYHRDGVRALNPGTAIVCDADRPFVRGFAKGLQELVLVVPKPLFAEITDDATPHRGEPYVTTFGKSHNADEFATGIASLMSDAMNERDNRRLQEIEDEVVDLLRGVFAGSGATSSRTRFRAVASSVDRHLRNPDLSAGMISALVGLSERQLSRVVSAEGYSMPQLIMERRLELAMRVLRSPKSVGMNITDVASYCGFSSLPTFSRMFSKKYGFSPSEVERAA